MAASGKRVIDQRLVRAVAHPLRVEILEALVSKGEMSPTEIAAALQSKPGNVSYHVNVLRECEVIELVRTEPRRGALEHYYRPAASIRAFIDLALAAFQVGAADAEDSPESAADAPERTAEEPCEGR